MKIDVSVIIVNFNNSEALQQCVNSVLDQVGVYIEILIVDNASTDNSVEDLTRYRERVKVVRLSQNLGYGTAINKGAEFAKGKYLAILNNDVVLPADALLNLIERLNLSTDSVCVAPRLVLPSGETQKSCRELPYLRAEIAELFGISRFCKEGSGNYFLTKWKHLNSRTVPQAAGAFLLLRRSIFFKIQGFDERYPLYYEDVDFCRKLNFLGSILYCHEVSVQHSFESTAKIYRYRTTIAIAIGKYRYYRLTQSRIKAELVRVTLILRCLSRGILLLLARNTVPDSRQKSKGYFTAISKLLKSPLKYDVLE